MACDGLILNHNEAMGSRKVSRYLPGLRDAIKTKNAAKPKQTKHTCVCTSYKLVFIKDI